MLFVINSCHQAGISTALLPYQIHGHLSASKQLLFTYSVFQHQASQAELNLVVERYSTITLVTSPAQCSQVLNRHPVSTSKLVHVICWIPSPGADIKKYYFGPRFFCLLSTKGFRIVGDWVHRKRWDLESFSCLHVSSSGVKSQLVV
jgi:hypothetical protein